MEEKIIGKQKFEENKPQKQLKEYKCVWCRNTFQAYVRRINAYRDDGERGKHGISTQVRCPYCLNFVKTW